MKITCVGSECLFCLIPFHELRSEGVVYVQDRVLESKVFVITAILTLITSTFTLVLVTDFFKPAFESHALVLMIKVLAI